MIAIGVVVVGQLFGFVGLFVAVPILSLIVISVEEFWVKPVEEAEARRARADIALPRDVEVELAGSDQLRDRDDRPDQDEDHDQDLNDDPEAGKLHRLSP